MRLTRRGFGGLAVGSLAATAGCSALEGATTFESAPASVPGSTQSETGYEHTETREMTVEREFSGQKVTAINHIAEHQKEVDFGPLGSAKLGVYVAFTTPAVEVAGKEFNPVSDMSREELVKRLQSRYDQIEDVREVGTFQTTVIGQSADASEFEATTTYDGQQIDLKILLAKVQHDYDGGNDFVIPIGVYPKEKAEEERPNVVSLMENTTHPAE